MFVMVLRAVLLTLVPLAATVAGASGAALRAPGRQLTAAVQHLAAGVVIAAVALEVVPPVRDRGTVVAVIGFSAGIVAMYALRRVTDRLEADPAGGGAVPKGMLVAIALDVFIDGLVLGAGFAAASRTGLLLTVALTLELLFLGVTAAAALVGGGVTVRRTIAVVTAIAGLLSIGTAIGVLALAGTSEDVLAVVLGFGAVALMYLVTEELLTEAHTVRDTPLATALLFVGFLVYLLVAEWLG